jgi:hypothetical protein
MAAILKIDGFDFYQYVRVAPGEGLDPASPGFQEPQFGETVTDDAQPLISVNERNKEMAWPVHLNAASKDALHDLLIDINKRLSNAVQVEWRDDGATASTFYDVVFARFDPDYNYRRGQRNWLSGMLRIWVKPYGTSGTYRLIASTISPSWGRPVFLPATSGLDGDVPAKMHILHYVGGVGTYSATAFQGISVMPTTAFGFFSAASINMDNVATVVGATTAIGSQALWSILSGGGVLTQGFSIYTSPSITLGGPITINNLSVPPGRNRVLGVLRANATNAASAIAMVAYDYDGDAICATQTISPSCNWQLVDFGIFTQPTQVPSAPEYAQVYGSFAPVGAMAGSARLEVAGMYVLPEESTIITKVTSSSRKRYVVREDESIDWVRDAVGDEVRRPVQQEFGVMPRLPVGTTMNKVMLFYQNAGGPAAMRQDIAYDSANSHKLYALERFTYAR